MVHFVNSDFVKKVIQLGHGRDQVIILSNSEI